MRVTRETREKTRQTILDRARELFAAVGFEASTTREIASAARIATGTLFNYFASKEALGLALVDDALAAAETEFDATRRAGESLEETLFAHVAIQLRRLAPMRGWIPAVFDAALSPLRAEMPGDLAGDLRRRHLERVAAWLETARGDRDAGGEDAVLLHLYWSLYLGVLSFWARDDTDHQEATLALLDRSMELFTRALREE